MLAFLLARVGAFADEAASTLYVNQLRSGASAFENLQSRRCPPPPKHIRSSHIQPFIASQPAFLHARVIAPAFASRPLQGFKGEVMRVCRHAVHVIIAYAKGN